MMTQTVTRHRLGGIALFALVAGLAQPALAQAPPETDPVSVPAGDQPAPEDSQEVVVTGSRIVRPNLDNSTPTLVVDSTLLNRQGFENIADIATSLPQFAPAFGGGRTTSSFSGATVSGLNTTNLRNLAAIRSVVLINGRRVPGGSPLSTFVDFNTLPTANIDRIEIITGGASAVYGADAVAGVVNVITKRNFTGLQAGASAGIAERGYNKTANGYLMLGTKLGDDGGRALFTLQYAYEGLVSCADAYICSTDIRYNNPAEGPVRAPASGLGDPPFSGVVPGGPFLHRRGQPDPQPRNRRTATV